MGWKCFISCVLNLCCPFFITLSRKGALGLWLCNPEFSPVYVPYLIGHRAVVSIMWVQQLCVRTKLILSLKLTSKALNINQWLEEEACVFFCNFDLFSGGEVAVRFRGFGLVEFSPSTKRPPTWTGPNFPFSQDSGTSNDGYGSLEKLNTFSWAWNGGSWGLWRRYPPWN